MIIKTGQPTPGQIQEAEKRAKAAYLQSLMAAQYAVEDFASFVKRVKPGYSPTPPHLQPIYDLIDRSRHEQIRALVSMPPRSGKSESFRLGLAYRTVYDPACQHAYATYGGDLSKETGLVVRELVRNQGVTIGRTSESSARGMSGMVLDWRTSAGGGVKSTSVGGAITGRGVTGLLVVDDPLKGAEAARSLAEKNRVWNWLRRDILSRLEGGSSCIIVQCIAEGEKIPMADGTWRNIEEIKPGDRVVGYDTENHKTVARTVSAQKCSGEDEIFEIRTDHYVLRANARHPILVVPDDGHRLWALRYQWRLVSDLKPGDVAVGIKSFNNGSDYGYLKSIGVPASDDFGWLFGFLLGDGWVTKYVRKNRNNQEAWAICCALSDPKRVYKRPLTELDCDVPTSGADLNDRFVQLMEFFFGSKPYKTGFGYMRCDDNNTGRFLDSLGLHAGKNAKEKSVPDWVFRAPRSFRREVLRGLLDADGGKPTKGRAFRLGTSSRDLTWGARRLALMSGARATAPNTIKQMARAPHSKELIDSTAFYTDIVVDYIDQEPEGTGSVKNWNGLDTRLVKVRSIEPVGRAKVYDLTVDGENFFPGGLCAHNTRWADDDPIGRMLSGGADWEKGLGEDWKHINLPAIHDGNGNPVDEREFPELAQPLWLSVNARFPNNRKAALDWYRICRLRDEIAWHALYMGNPRGEGQKVYAVDPAKYDMPITMQGKRALIVLDAAAKKTTASDHNALGCATMDGHGDRTVEIIDQKGRRFEVINPKPSTMSMIEVWKERCSVPDAIKEARKWQLKYLGLTVGIEADGSGANIPDWVKLTEPRMKFIPLHTRGRDKRTRAIPSSKAWNDDRILVPSGLDKQGNQVAIGWDVVEYIRVMKAFTGLGDPEDDVVDVTAWLWNRLFKPFQPRDWPHHARGSSY